MLEFQVPDEVVLPYDVFMHAICFLVRPNISVYHYATYAGNGTHAVKFSDFTKKKFFSVIHLTFLFITI
jgi:hypothetical protein